ncbi:glycosylphosphatidylinositol anchored high density lipoprotein binding protein 1 [Phyllostomus discolor]|uniref:Glycosylphosphatidylinositol-anchored high density lipoprotein-binding protein 1 n=1 Tax=Phyllostomus discolor TaxID=89673 RepID=A0A7E6E6Z7_9CHIR|nr:glycosylphosphatidylinositol-anchored high density lipoprotein-binding protein 1 [Phyllostomus discolor]KAF6099421.1 glycosylphosphatidylinositol anchored high density lipoprotein binding protein 1 [Phyllostomus discolor]
MAGLPKASHRDFPPPVPLAGPSGRGNRPIVGGWSRGQGPEASRKPPAVPFASLPTGPHPGRMKALVAVLLALLLCRQPGAPVQPGRGQAQDERDHTDEDEDEDEDEQREEEEEEEEEEDGAAAGSRGGGLQCYSCQSLPQQERCHQTRSCRPSEPFCKTIVSEGDTGSGPLTSSSGWCSAECKPIAKMTGGTLITITCCQTNLCNAPPWQSQPGTGAGGPQGSPETVATALLLSLLPGLGAMGS